MVNQNEHHDQSSPTSDFFTCFIFTILDNQELYQQTKKSVNSTLQKKKSSHCVCTIIKFTSLHLYVLQNGFYSKHV